MPEFARRTVFVAVGMLLFLWGGRVFDGSGGISSDNRLGALTLTVAIIGVTMAAFGVFGHSRRRP